MDQNLADKIVNMIGTFENQGVYLIAKTMTEASLADWPVAQVGQDVVSSEMTNYRSQMRVVDWEGTFAAVPAAWLQVLKEKGIETPYILFVDGDIEAMSEAELATLFYGETCVEAEYVDIH